MRGDIDVDAVDRCLPQTQCTRCGYPDCRGYAHAIVQDAELINRCPPGGEITIDLLSQLLGTARISLDTSLGLHHPRQVARIDESRCIGCALCIKACPVDAIVGAGKLMHTVITAECTGCELCLPPCPVDCIDIAPLDGADGSDTPWPGYRDLEVTRARSRYRKRLARLEAENRTQPAAESANDASTRSREVADTLERLRRRRATDHRP